MTDESSHGFIGRARLFRRTAADGDDDSTALSVKKFSSMRHVKPAYGASKLIASRHSPDADVVAIKRTKERSHILRPSLRLKRVSDRPVARVASCRIGLRAHYFDFFCQKNTSENFASFLLRKRLARLPFQKTRDARPRSRPPPRTLRVQAARRRSSSYARKISDDPTAARPRLLRLRRARAHACVAPPSRALRLARSYRARPRLPGFLTLGGFRTR